MLPPDIDQRSYTDLVRQTQDLAEAYTPWRSPAADRADAGLALIRIFSRMLATVSDRLNRVTERNLLAYINLIGTQITPAQPARVPLTFKLSAGSSIDVLVPARTQVAAPPTEDQKEEIFFETEQDLLVSRTQLQAIFVLEDRDYYSDRSAHADAAIASQIDAFSAFRGSRPLEHYLYLSCEAVFQLPGLAAVTITIDTDSSDSASRLRAMLQTWCCWQDKGKVWQAIERTEAREAGSQVVVTLSQLPPLLPSTVNGVKAQWLRISLSPHQRKVLPEILQIQVRATLNQVHHPKACTFNRSVLDLSKDFYPFGTAPLHNDAFAIQLDPALIKPGVAVELQATLSHVPLATPDLELIWEIGNGQIWQPIAAFSDSQSDSQSDSHGVHWRGPAAFHFSETRVAATLQFPAVFQSALLPGDTANSTAGHTSPDCWIRARIAGGLYGIRGRERRYVIYNDTTLLSQPIAAGQRELIVDSVDEVQVGDSIRLQTTIGEPCQEEATIIGKLPAEKKLVLDHATRNRYDAGTRLLIKFVMTETAADTFDPPLIQSLTVAYQFTLERSAHYVAYNDFNYCDSQPLQARLSHSAAVGEQVITLDRVSPFSLGEFVRFDDGLPEKCQIGLIDPEGRRLIFTEPLQYQHSRSARLVRCFHPLTPALHQDSALYIGFDQPFSNRPNTLYLQVEPPAPQEVAPGVHEGLRVSNSERVIWEYASKNGWQPLVVQDETQALEESGLVQFIGPTDFISSSYCGKSLYWLRVRKKADEDSVAFGLICFFQWTLDYEQMILYGMMRDLLRRISQFADFAIPPRLRSIQTNTTWATQTITLNNEVLGSSNSELNQSFFTTHSPILLNPQLEVQEPQMPSEAEQRLLRQQAGDQAITPVLDDLGRVESVWIRWQQVPDFYASGPNDRHYVVDYQTGEIRFGNGQAGMIPSRGRNNIRLVRYQIGGGRRGNRPAETIVELKTTIPYLDGVSNWEAAKGGSDQESLERVKERAPLQIRHRDRAVTAQDFEDLTYEASTEVARVKVITPEMMIPNFNPLLEELWIEPQGSSPDRQPIAGNEIRLLQHDLWAGRVQVIIVPHGTVHQPTPTLALLNRVEAFLQSRFVPTLKLRVTGPKWQEIRVITELVPLSVANADGVRLAAEQQIQRFLHPLSGGSQGMGWNFGRIPHLSDLYAVLEAVPGVNYVRALEIQPARFAIDQQTLIYSGRHSITLKLPLTRS